ncbi:MAG TPA: DUF4080 domain-containing protein [Bacillota bacterium]|nr:DUF4080 domain-containing protein [Bacillota bacterium]
MRVLLTTLNAKYIHAALGIHTIKAYSESHGFEVIVQEYTINQDLGWILSHLMRREPEVLGISCNIWNVEETKALIRRIKKIAPKILLIIGGPEFSAAPESFIDCGADFGIVGEGEKPFLGLLQALTTGKPYDAIPGVVWRDGERQRTNPVASPISLDELAFPYSEDVLRAPGRIFYYETMRGCPFSCSYCLSGTEKVIRKRSLDQVFADLERLVAAGIRQVKFVDRTFNADPRRCERILSYIIEHYGDSGVNFHMELVAELLDDPLMALLNQAPKGLFRAEVGIQSLHAPTLMAVHRHVNPVRLEQNLRNLLQPQNIPIHLDLIAGLPEEGWEEFAGTFDSTFNLRPAEIQLGILKLLKGSELGRKGRELGYLVIDEAPYEILETPWLSFGEIQRLKTMAHLVEVLYNSGHFRHALPLLLSGEGRSPFQMLDRLVSRWEQEALDILPPNLKQIFDFLRVSVQELLPIEAGQTIIELLRMDRALADWSFDQGEGWGTPPDLPETLSTLLSDECWVEQNLPMMLELKPAERRRRVRRLTLKVDPRYPVSGFHTAQIILYRPLKGRVGYMVLEV